MSNKNSALIHFHLYSLGVDTCARHAMKLGKEKKVTCNCIELLLIFFVCCIFFWNIAVWQFYFLSKKQLHVSSFVDRCFVIVFSSSVFRFHRLLIVVVTFRLSFHRHRHQNLKPLSFTKTLSRGNQKVVNFVKTAILLYVQKTSTFSKDSQSLKVFLLAVLWKLSEPKINAIFQKKNK